MFIITEQLLSLLLLRPYSLSVANLFKPFVTSFTLISHHFCWFCDNENIFISPSDYEASRGTVHVPPPNTPASLIPSHHFSPRSPSHNITPHNHETRSYEFTPNQPPERFFERTDSYNYPTSYPESPDIQSPPVGYGFSSNSNSPRSPSTKLPPKSPGSRASGSVFLATSPLTSPGIRSTGRVRSGSRDTARDTARPPSVRSSSKPLSGETRSAIVLLSCCYRAAIVLL